MKLQIQKLDDRAIVPTYATDGSSCFDLHGINEVCLYPGQRVLIDTGLAFNIPKGFEIQIRPRSGMAIKYGITVLNAPGTVDSDYTGSVKVVLINHGKGVLKIEEGDRVAQAVVAMVSDQTQFELVETIDKSTSRGDGGFGHTGVKSLQTLRQLDSTRPQDWINPTHR